VDPPEVRDLLKEVTTSRRRFSQEFKDELCQEVISTSGSIKDVALTEGVNLSETYFGVS